MLWKTVNTLTPIDPIYGMNTYTQFCVKQVHERISFLKYMLNTFLPKDKIIIIQYL